MSADGSDVAATGTLPDDVLDLVMRELRANLTSDEAVYLDTIRSAPQLTVVPLEGGLAIQLEFFGAATSIGWDGSTDDARALAIDLGASAAATVSADYWINGAGWKPSQRE